MVRMAVRRYVPEGHGVVGGRLDLPARPDSGGVPVEEERQQHSRVVGGGATPRAGRSQRSEVELRYDLHHEAGEVVFGKPVLNGLGE